MTLIPTPVCVIKTNLPFSVSLFCCPLPVEEMCNFPLFLLHFLPFHLAFAVFLFRGAENRHGRKQMSEKEEKQNTSESLELKTIICEIGFD